MTTTLFILYNAEASVMGKLSYGYRKLTCSKDKTICAACDITHGGLHLDETAEWKKAKSEIVSQGGVQIKQLHRDEMDKEMKQYVETNKLSYPAVISSKDGQGYDVIMDSEELGSLGGSAQQFVQRLQEKGVLSGSTPSL